ncbi:hypothetical protein [Deinococcus yunweiensis]|uniref:hypothetical protein n=1 Tax=Deinococcus yunweiensis TaxID=367282 RepID=UPI00398E52E0
MHTGVHRHVRTHLGVVRRVPEGHQKRRDRRLDTGAAHHGKFDPPAGPGLEAPTDDGVELGVRCPRQTILLDTLLTPFCALSLNGVLDAGAPRPAERVLDACLQ